MDARIDGKAIIITGAARGIGAAIARQAAASGAQLLLTDRDGPALEQIARELAAGGAASHAADLTDRAAPGSIAGACIARFGRIDGLVNAAGLTDRASFLDGTQATWDRLFDVNTRAPFFLMQAAITDMRARGAGGTIVNIQSVNAHCGAPDLAIYSATKGALQTLTRNAAHAHMAERIRVNGINLGWAATESEDHMQSVVLGKGPAWRTEAEKTMPLGRLITPVEAARLAVYLLSDASAPMSGASIDLEQKVPGAPG
ncbi:SDR family oxidoreductase [Ponticoccus sp. SC2-23]|uniref:oxidoreductase n=1 Tax=Alexandriicola marinus TaxID=2081710 RepID=UPI000FDCABCF|nr:oxidoreductase [Alexandriicola marinus]MBM1221665.1 SDR family oxidoreductase [Ponticoccus sp. SC6-9]MBM1226706.1 SDR family oxidoreductase [Ponticoccus sp. SC6-15]MBM1230657.1 SDR family oxidoreductase [Ponticoccus sp. SC6-38]MBM1235180.1 SDR family oxidoreductase [Ponticoccus sp. SC6-45]MBM1239678.1 SDR family oxidoreductase [Ponticoccus sp. SC6-49]MBM1243460.1 SDR family oxidoreductase [Ponticoccus sp. SC2-64]MBM1248704.1 SDR family oxidoreductase [Ponticoccus sp. SC6-42]MBM1253289.1 